MKNIVRNLIIMSCLLYFIGLFFFKAGTFANLSIIGIASACLFSADYLEYHD